MPTEELKHEKIRKIISLLDQALYNHQQWYNALLRSLICKIIPDQHDMNFDAHKQCRFGQWYYSVGSKDFENHAGFRALGIEHERMHQLSRKLLNTIETGMSISTVEYDSFSNSLERMRLELLNLKRELENSLYNLDPLTGAINRDNLLTTLRELQEVCKRVNQTCCIVIIDIDHFKSVNDTYGHPVGDVVLVNFVQYFLKNLRPEDKLFRYGGEEFIIYFNNMDLDETFKRIEGLRIGLAETDLVSQPPLRITATFGIALLDPYFPVEVAIEHADMALLAAKANRNCTMIWKAKN